MECAGRGGVGRKEGQVQTCTCLGWGLASILRAWGKGNPENGTNSSDLRCRETCSGVTQADRKGMSKPWGPERGHVRQPWVGQEEASLEKVPGGTTWAWRPAAGGGPRGSSQCGRWQKPEQASATPLSVWLPLKGPVLFTEQGH